MMIFDLFYKSYRIMIDVLFDWLEPSDLPVMFVSAVINLNKKSL